jgi:hypothetical protein
VTTQRAQVAAWWFAADETTQRRALRVAVDDVLPQDIADSLSAAGVVLPFGEVDGRAGAMPPQVLVEFLAGRLPHGTVLETRRTLAATARFEDENSPVGRIRINHDRVAEYRTRLRQRPSD